MQVAQPGGVRVSAPRLRQSWVPPRRTIGTSGIFISLAGVGYFVWLVGSHTADSIVTAKHTAAAVTILVGLHIARWAFDSQAAANRREAERADLADVVIRQARLSARQEAMMAQVPTRDDIAATVDEAVKVVHAGGYVRGMRRRLGGGGHLRSVPPTEE